MKIIKRKFLLRYKLLGVLTLIPLITLAVYLVLAVRIFKEDKLAYVYDSSSTFVGSLAGQVKTQLQSVLYDARPFLQEYLNKKQFDQQATTLFTESSGIDHLMIYRIEVNSDQIAAQANLTKDQARLPEVAKEVEDEILVNNAVLLKKIKAEKRAFLRLKKNEFALIETFESHTEQGLFLFAAVVKLSEVVENFQNSKAQQVFLIHSNGEILLGPESDGNEVLNMNELIDFSAFEQSMKKAPQGVEELINKNQESALASFSKTGYGDLFVLSMVNKSNALSAVTTLIRRSLIFFGVLICITVIISLLAASQLTSAITQLFTATKKVSEGQFDVQVEVTSNDEIASLAENFNLMAQQIAKLMVDTAQKARMENELQTAKTVQETLFPEAEYIMGPLHIAGHYEPASECGGDWWHYCYVGNKIYLWIGDATGHGAPAALITSAAKSAATLIESLNISPSQAIELMNQAIYDVSKGKIMMTFALIAIDLKANEIVYVNASHEAPFLIRKQAGGIKKKDLTLLNETNNPRLGQGRDSKYKESRLELKPGDFLFLYTDGIADIQNPELKAWGEREFLKNFIAAYNTNLGPVEFKNDFAAKISDYRQSTLLVDDVTFFAVKYNGEQKDVGEQLNV